MSCMMLTDESLAILSMACAKITTYPEQYQIFPPYSLQNALHGLPSNNTEARAQKIFDRLYLLNLSAYAERYRENFVPIVPDINLNTYYDILPRYEYNPKTKTGTVHPIHYRLYKIIQCFLYQVDDGKEARTDPLVLGLQDLERYIANYIISNTTAYNTAPWG